ncbi:starch-binding protein [Ruminococcus sp.]|uniref:starch-binding protein n=1 Tax=Ruminococcus sp. TaxID=41978 RepID=UPI003869ED6F
MVTTKHKVLSLILCIMLAVSAVCAGSMAVSAATGDTVYVRVNNGWTNLHCYMWTDGSGNNSAWPGAAMTKVEDGVYSYTLTGDFKKVIFNNGSGGNGNQTGDLTYAGNGQIYDLSAGTWSAYSGATNPTQATQPTTAPSGDVKPIYCQNDAGWSNVYCYMWNGSSDSNAAWPGKPMTEIGDNVWSYTPDKTYKNVIFNSGSNQTADLTVGSDDLYNNKTNTWSVYDTSDIQITSYKADPVSSIYTGTAVTLSTTAKSLVNATISYQISVNGKVVSPMSAANSYVWTPTAVGTYTIKFEYSDTKGNTNERSLTLTVNDDSTLVKPVIKNVTPLNLNYIKLNTKATVKVLAGGGKTGTNLLFYKYVVTDPNGTKNIPYYTLNDSYSFVPTIKGTYTVEVFVEGSDNSKVSKTYTYTADSNVPTTTTPQPTVTVPTPSTQPTTVTVPTTAPQPTTTPVLKGDCNGDGVVNVNDVTYLQMIVAEYEGLTYDFDVCDIDGNGILDIIDATKLQSIVSES